MKWLLLLLATVALAGCVRPGDYPISSNCVWSEDDGRSLDLTKILARRHLRFDAVTAEDVAIRWADKNFGHLPQYEQRRDECMTTLFEGVAKQHGVDVATVRQSSRERDPLTDAVVILSFGVGYTIATYIFAGRTRRRFPPGEPGFWIMTVCMAAGVSLVGVMVGSLWSIVIEGVVLNSGHLSYRMNRIPFRHYWALLLVCCFIVFAFVSLLRSRSRFSRHAQTTTES